MANFDQYLDERKGICVVRRPDETTEQVIKRFRKKVTKSGIQQEIRSRLYFEKPSIRKRKKRIQAERIRMREKQKMMQRMERLRKKRLKEKRQKKDKEVDHG